MIIHTGMRTDIPAFYSEWFLHRIQEGMVCVRNPYNPSQVTKYSLSPEVVDLIAATLKNRHVERLKAGECTIELGTQFLELLINLERMSDHCSNVALHILRQTSSPDDKVRIDSHAYMHELHHGGFNQEFDDLFQEYRTKYFQPIARDPERV